MKKILIIGAGGSTGIAFTRCLQISPETFFLVGTDCNEFFVHLAETNVKILAPPASHPKYVETLNEIIEKFKVEFLHAQPDVEIEVISKNREKIDAEVFLPKKKTIEICHDKFKSNQIWEGKNVPTAKTLLVKNRDDLKNAFDRIGSPLWIRAVKGWAGRGSLLVKNYAHAEMWIDYFDGWGNFMASEYLSGANFGWDAVFKDGELVCYHTKQRLRYMLSGASLSGITGTTGVAKSINGNEIVELAKKAVYAVDPKPDGVFSVDLKENRNNTLCVTEINPGRFLSSSLHFFYKAKCLIPYIYVKLAFEEKIEANTLKKIDSGVVLVRQLDKEPTLIEENKIKALVEARRKNRFVVI